MRVHIFIVTLFMSAITMAGDFSPQDFKEFLFREGDLLASQREDGKFAINKVLRVDKVTLEAGKSISIQGQIFTAPEKDFLLIVSMSYGESEFSSIEDAKETAEKGTWSVQMGHIPNRSPGAAHGQVLVGHQPVEEDELVGYKQWLELFDQNKAGVF